MKGVKKIVLEVRPENEYFEKALLFLDPDKLNESQKNISDSANLLLSDITPQYYRKKYNFRRLAFPVFAGIATGSIITWGAVLLIGLL
ncbi:MAG: hypothetical protein IK093_15705 [Ruminiclostridium sp.]|nr:hypothetical protein [Ruminiclostridium sp.]